MNKHVLLFILCITVHICHGQTGPGHLPEWLLGLRTYPVTENADKTNGTLVLSNGLVKRTFSLGQNPVCSGFTNLIDGKEILRAKAPEAVLMVDGRLEVIGNNDGGKGGQDFAFLTWNVGALSPGLKWKTGFWAYPAAEPSGKELTLQYKGRGSSPVDGLEVDIHYAFYDNLPLCAKWVTLVNHGNKTYTIDSLISEYLRVENGNGAYYHENAGQVFSPGGLYIETDYNFNDAYPGIHWNNDGGLALQVYPFIGPGNSLKPGDGMASVKTYEILVDAQNKENRGLAVRNMYRVIAPWTNANPIFFHLVYQDDKQLYAAIDQCAATGYEAILLSFWGNFNMDDVSDASIKKWKAVADYARGKGVAMGGYSLFSSRNIDDADDVLNPKTGKPGGGSFGYAPCYGSKWGLNYLKNVEYFLSNTGFTMLESDGPYPGDICVSTQHPGHKGMKDSQWEQQALQKSLYHWCIANGIYVNAPGWFVLDGTAKCSLGYNEFDFSQPRATQVFLDRKTIYDGTWGRNTSMSWGMVPLTVYHGGGTAATVEPLSANIEDYKRLMFQYYSAGIQSCYRGTRVYDSPETEKAVTEMIQWYKKYRQILNSNVIHLRDVDGKDWDGILHAEPGARIKGLMVLYNPLGQDITRTISIPLSYMGLHSAQVLESDTAPLSSVVNGEFANVTVTLPANGYKWFTIK